MIYKDYKYVLMSPSIINKEYLPVSFQGWYATLRVENNIYRGMHCSLCNQHNVIYTFEVRHTNHGEVLWLHKACMEKMNIPMFEVNMRIQQASTKNLTSILIRKYYDRNTSSIVKRLYGLPKIC